MYNTKTGRKQKQPPYSSPGNFEIDLKVPTRYSEIDFNLHLHVQRGSFDTVRVAWKRVHRTHKHTCTLTMKPVNTFHNSYNKIMYANIEDAIEKNTTFQATKFTFKEKVRGHSTVYSGKCLFFSHGLLACKTPE